MKKALIILLISFVSCKSPSDKKTENSAVELEQLQTSIDSLFNSHIGENEPGAAVLVTFGGNILIKKGFGLRDLRTKTPITPSTNMRIASVSKQFTALTVLSLVDQGLISLNDTVSNYLPYEAFRKVTIQQLLNHTSGIANYDRYLDNWDKPRIAENSDVLDWYATNPDPEFEPGTRYEYSNAAYNVLATLVEKVSRTEFSEYAKANIFKKAGMEGTNYFNLAKPVEIKERAFCYERDSNGIWKQVDSNILNGLIGEGAIYTSLNDYFNYDSTLRNESILSKKMHNLIFKPSSTYTWDGNEIHYAMGWNIKDSIAIHSGGWYGTNTIVKRYLNKPLTIAIFMNRNTLFKSDLVKKTDAIVNKYLNNR